MARTTALVDEFREEGSFVPSESLADFVASIRTPRAVVVMVKAGEGTDAVIDDLVPLLEAGDIVVDAGNAHVADTLRRQQALEDHDLHCVGMGVSGGEEGALHGPSIMVGGSDHAYERLGPILEDIAARVEGTPCCAHVGPDGAGHFVKMVHNGIEYADRQLIAEAYDLLRNVLGLEPGRIAEVFREWNQGDLESFLIETAADVLAHTDAETGRPFVDVVADAAEQKGTGRWTVQNALDLGVPVTGIAEATFARSISGHVEQREAARKVFAQPDAAADLDDPDGFVADVRAALYAAKVVAYAQGFDQIVAGSEEHEWDVDPGEMATIWRGDPWPRQGRIGHPNQSGHGPAEGARTASPITSIDAGPQPTTVSIASNARRPKATNRASSTRVGVLRSVSTAAATASSNGQP